MRAKSPRHGWLLPVPHRRGAGLRSEARRILTEGQFHAQRGWLQRVLDWFGDRLGFELGPSGHILSDVVVVVLASLIALALAALARSVARRGPGQGGRRPARAGVVVSDPERPMSAQRWRAEAERFAALGDMRESLRCRYRALVAALAAERLLEEGPGRTAREHARLLGSRAPGAAPAFAHATAVFEDVWYGGATAPGPEGQADFDRLAQSVLEASGGKR